ncbi:hypothetical protein EDD21DRAFT_358465 [Dissophora ornata]|nr:hypothetical protein EDD21DRAFT_358465 [Dissophora ornata]
MKFILFTLAALAACVSHAVADNTTFAPPPLGVVGHTAVVANNTVFIQGGENKNGSLSTVSYAIILDSKGSLSNATFQDTSAIAQFTPRDFGIVIPYNGSILTCGTTDGGRTDMTCDLFDTYTYNLSRTNFGLSSAGGNRGGMAVAISTSKAYIVGGYIGTTLSAATYVMNLSSNSSTPAWSTTGSLPAGLKYHTATWVDGTTSGVLVLGGISSLSILPLNSAQIYSSATGSWTQTPK